MQIKIELIPDPKYSYEEGIVKLINQWQNGFGEDVAFIKTDLPIINIRLFNRDNKIAEHFQLFNLYKISPYTGDPIFSGAWIDIILIKDDSIDIYKLKDQIESSFTEIAALVIIDNTLEQNPHHRNVLTSLRLKKIDVYSSNTALNYLENRLDLKYSTILNDEMEGSENFSLKITYLGFLFVKHNF